MRLEAQHAVESTLRGETEHAYRWLLAQGFQSPEPGVSEPLTDWLDTLDGAQLHALACMEGVA